MIAVRATGIAIIFDNTSRIKSTKIPSEIPRLRSRIIRGDVQHRGLNSNAKSPIRKFIMATSSDFLSDTIMVEGAYREPLPSNPLSGVTEKLRTCARRRSRDARPRCRNRKIYMIIVYGPLC